MATLVLSVYRVNKQKTAIRFRKVTSGVFAGCIRAIPTSQTGRCFLIAAGMWEGGECVITESWTARKIYKLAIANGLNVSFQDAEVRDMLAGQ